MDDHLFRLWKEEKCTIEDCLAKAHNGDELAKRIVNFQRSGMDEPVPMNPENDPNQGKRPPGH